MRPTPLLPFSWLANSSSGVLPSEEITPMPAMTTRRRIPVPSPLLLCPDSQNHRRTLPHVGGGHLEHAPPFHRRRLAQHVHRAFRVGLLVVERARPPAVEHGR